MFAAYRFALSLCVTALLAACGPTQPPIVTPPTDDPQALPYHKTFRFDGKKQSFEVPSDVKWITVVARGAAGDGFHHGGRGGRVYAEIPVTAGEHLIIVVGGGASGPNGGFNGGGDGVGYSGAYDTGYGGGGASDIRVGHGRLVDRILVAGGGGGQGGYPYNNYGAGGKGGGSAGGNGSDGAGSKTSGSGNTAGLGGGGGTQQSGGMGGAGGDGGYGYGENGGNGSLGEGGTGAPGAGSSGGGAGGGYYGGGGGGGGGWGYGDDLGGGGGGGGGSSYVERSARRYTTWKGWKTATGDGLIVFGWKRI